MPRRAYISSTAITIAPEPRNLSSPPTSPPKPPASRTALSSRSQSTIRRITALLFDLAEPNPVAHYTLTLPGIQYHPDQHISAHFSRFLSAARRSLNLRHYIFRSDKGNSGQLHFHFATSDPLDFFRLQRLWSRQCLLAGYPSTSHTSLHLTYHTDHPNLAKYLSKDAFRPIAGRGWGTSKSLRERLALDVTPMLQSELDALPSLRFRPHPAVTVHYFPRRSKSNWPGQLSLEWDTFLATR